MHSFTLIFLFFLVASVTVRLWLCQRQLNHIQRHKNQVPEEFTDKIKLVDHQKAAEYSCTGLRVGRVSLAWETAWLLVWTLGGGLSAIDHWWANYQLLPLLNGIAVVISLVVLTSILDLPSSLYSTFVVEQRFGFNQTTWRTWILDLVKTATLMLVLGIPLIATILWLMNQAGEYWWLYAWLVWTAFSLLMIWAWPTFIAPLFNRFSALEDASLKSRIDSLLQRCGFQSEGVYVVDGSRRSAHGNAYFTGFGKNKRIVFYDTLLELLSEDEIEAVLAHELGHFKRHHIKKSLILSLFISLIGFALLAWLMQSDWFYAALGVEVASTHAALLLFILIMPVFTYFISPLFSALSRRHEFEADEFAKSNSDYRALISALVNMYRDNASTLTPDPVHSLFYDSHPPASIRINHLKSSAGGTG
ncbi:MAG: M48 family metallopeptidase [Gammaproteobacteria bacterium]|nr:M48 family metallopeptidase [Gammaproteobacteria bacterium]